MQAFLIDAYEQTIEPIEIEATLDAIRQQPRPGRFQLDTLPPVAGRGVVVGGGPDEGSLRAPELSLEALRGRVRFS